MNHPLLKKIGWSIVIAALMLNFCIPAVAQQQVRGASVKVKNDQTGKTEEVKIYKASYALVIGVSDYTNGWQSLPGVRADAEAVSAALKEQGFAVTTVLNPKKTEMTEAIEKFINDYGYEYENRLLIYYAGHGNTLKAGAGYEQGFIVPADAPAPKVGNEAEFRRLAVSMDTIERYAQEINAKHALFVFDSCFSGSLITKTRSPVPPQITFKTTQPVRQFITAGTDEQEVPDISEFRKQFVNGIKGEADRNGDTFITASELADFLQDKVSRYTRGSQTPQYGKIRDARLDKGDFVFVLPEKTPENIITNNEPFKPDAPLTARSRSEIEREAWSYIKSSTDAQDYRDFLKEFPDGANAGNAKIKLEQSVWDAVKDSKDKAKIQSYLNEFPLGANTFLAKTRLRQIEAAVNTPVQPSNPANNSSTTSAKTAGAVSKARLPNNVEMSFAYIPAGEFQMGSNNGESKEKPVHTVRISQGFQMGITEVTQAQWEAVMGSNPSNFKNCLQCPVEQVSWEDAQQFIAKLNGQNDGYKYRLPTESEWEYAARAGTTGDYAGSLDAMAWYSNNSDSKTHPVGTKSPNSWGLYDMHGNVWEWVQDWYGAYPSGAVTDPSGAASGSYRVVRGGSWVSPAAGARSADRSRAHAPSYRSIGVGFRVVRQ